MPFEPLAVGPSYPPKDNISQFLLTVGAALLAAPGRPQGPPLRYGSLRCGL